MTHSQDRLPVRNPTTGIICDTIGIGSRAAWYGTPDARVRANDGMVIIDWQTPDDESGESILVEGKLGKAKMRNEVIGQVVATVITHSFTEHCNHPTLNAMTPMILLDENHIVILLYDCEQDVLLLSKKIPYFDENKKLMDVGVVVAWLAISFHQKAVVIL